MKILIEYTETHQMIYYDKVQRKFPTHYNNKVMIQSMEEQGWKLKSVEKGQPIMEMIIPKIS